MGTKKEKKESKSPTKTNALTKALSEIESLKKKVRSANARFGLTNKKLTIAVAGLERISRGRNESQLKQIARNTLNSVGE